MSHAMKSLLGGCITLSLSCASQPTASWRDAPGTDVRTQILYEETLTRWAEEDRAWASSQPRRAPVVPTLTSATVVVEKERAIARITEERCARETACNNIGAGKPHSSGEACMAEVRAATASELTHDECRGGVDPERFVACVHEIRSEMCGNPFERLERIAACRARELCAR